MVTAAHWLAEAFAVLVILAVATLLICAIPAEFQWGETRREKRARRAADRAAVRRNARAMGVRR